ncbi:unnamed protein product [Phytomonas sp. Hart1]|nr:unnamed protein product [Phytomonas sp. Hart1]|eukprot:CCW69704.1 unnamed protein product [Phytomonas sp. isolate Hart1]
MQATLDKADFRHQSVENGEDFVRSHKSSSAPPQSHHNPPHSHSSRLFNNISGKLYRDSAKRAVASAPSSPRSDRMMASPPAEKDEFFSHALPSLPGLFSAMPRLPLFYVMDGDGDGRFSREDITRFTTWAATKQAEWKKRGENAYTINNNNVDNRELLQAYAVLECWRRCQWEGQRLSRVYFSHYAEEGDNSSDVKRFRRQSLVLLILMFFDEFDVKEKSPKSTVGEAALHTDENILPFDLEISPEQGDLFAGVHFARWVLRLLYQRELSRRRAVDYYCQTKTKDAGMEEKEEKLFNALLVERAADFTRLHRRGWVTLQEVAAVYDFFGGEEILSLSFWEFCRALHLKSAKEVEAALSLSTAAAVKTIKGAAVVESARRRVALELISRHRCRGFGATESFEKGFEKNALSVEEGKASPPSSSFYRITEGEEGIVTEASPVPSFIVSRYTLLVFIHNIMTSHWDTLRTMGFSPYTKDHLQPSTIPSGAR